MRRPILLKAEGLMLAAREAIEKGEPDKAIRYLEMAIEDVKEYAQAHA
jgi:hypothetical protein